MKNELQWIQIGNTVYELQDDNNTLATLSHNKVENLWYLEFEYGFTDTVFLPDTIDKMKRNTLDYIMTSCNQKITEYKDIWYRVAMCCEK